MSVLEKLASSLRKRARWLVGAPPTRTDLLRAGTIARAYLRGEGIEIGGLHHPLKVSRKARVRYVDRVNVAELRKEYPELESQALVDVDIIDDGETLRTIGDATQDFVIANHFLEHCQDPIGAVRSMLRVLRDGGNLYLAIPDKRYTFDRDRPVTPLEHLLRDHEEGPARSRRQHFEEWTRLVRKIGDAGEAQREIDRLMAAQAPIHYHVWTQTELLELVSALRRMCRFEVELILRGDKEVIVVLRKGSTADAAVPLEADGAPPDLGRAPLTGG